LLKQKIGQKGAIIWAFSSFQKPLKVAKWAKIAQSGHPDC